jgi:NAD(P)-dependent dehydrogenase (short-subunit alcohol dehydrogenase family)
MKTIVITGSTRGIGLGMAQEFLRQGCQVVINGRTPEAVQAAMEKCAAIAGKERLWGVVGSSANPADLQKLWDEAAAHFGRVDVWINNAGISNMLRDFWALEPDELRCVIETNVMGSMYGSRIAIRGMLEQGGGALYNLEGLGSDKGARKVRGLVPYGTSKAALRYFDDALMKEMEGLPVIVGALQPGMVYTDMISKQYENDPSGWEKNKRILTILSQPVDVVAPFLARRILENQKNGTRIQFSSTFKIMSGFIKAAFKKEK